jgi:predicted neutral ceramidase superfamily lipid hydrolase
MNPPKIFVFILLYYVVWFLSIYFALKNMGYVALLVSIVISLIQTAFFITQDNLKPFMIWFMAFTLLGYLVDTLFQLFGILSFESNTWGSHYAPPWILALWINFSVLCF